MPDKTRIETRIETQRRPVVLPLRGAEVLVAVRGPSPGEGGREKAKVRPAPAPPAPPASARGAARRAPRTPRPAPRLESAVSSFGEVGKLELGCK